MKRKTIQEHEVELTSDDIVAMLRHKGIHVGKGYTFDFENTQKHAGMDKHGVVTFSWTEPIQDTDIWPAHEMKA